MIFFRRLPSLMTAVLALLLIGAAGACEREPIWRDGETPLRFLSIGLPKSQHPLLFETLKAYAGEKALDIRITAISPSDEFLIEMWRKEYHIRGTNAVEVTEFKLGIYRNDPEIAVGAERLDAITADLESYISSNLPDAQFQVVEQSD